MHLLDGYGAVYQSDNTLTYYKTCTTPTEDIFNLDIPWKLFDGRRLPPVGVVTESLDYFFEHCGCVERVWEACWQRRDAPWIVRDIFRETLKECMMVREVPPLSCRWDRTGYGGVHHQTIGRAV